MRSGGRTVKQRSLRLKQTMSDVRYAESTTNNQPAMAYDAVDDQNIELATGKALALLELELFFGITGLPRRVLFTRDDPHAVRRLRHRARLIIGQEMRPLQHALLWA